MEDANKQEYFIKFFFFSLLNGSVEFAFLCWCNHHHHRSAHCRFSYFLGQSGLSPKCCLCVSNQLPESLNARLTSELRKQIIIIIIINVVVTLKLSAFKRNAPNLCTSLAPFGQVTFVCFSHLTCDITFFLNYRFHCYIVITLLPDSAGLFGGMRQEIAFYWKEITVKMLTVNLFFSLSMCAAIQTKQNEIPNRI